MDDGVGFQVAWSDSPQAERPECPGWGTRSKRRVAGMVVWFPETDARV